MPMIYSPLSWRSKYTLGMVGAIRPKPIPSISGTLASDLTVAGLDTATFTRSTTATCTDYLGNLITCAVNEPRFEGGRRISEGVWSDVKPDGSPIYPTPKLLMEGQSTNYFLQSDSPANHTSPTCPAGTYTLWLTGTGSVAVAAGTAVGSGWGPATSATPLTVTIGTGGTVVFTVTGTVTTAQFEPLPVKSSYIPTTTAAVTRTADACSWPLSTELQAMLSIDKAWTTSLADETGLTWGPEKNQSSFADGQSWFDHPDKDLSSYANSGKMMILRDSAGRLAWGFIGAAGTGQTLGSELLVNGGFDTDTTSWITSNVSAFTSEPGGINGNYGKIVASAPYPSIHQTIVSNKLKGSLYSLTINSKSISGNNLTIKPYITTQSGSFYSLSDTWTEFKKYQNYTYTGSPKPIFYALIGNAALNTIVGVDSVSLKEILAPSAKGVYIYKDQARSLQGWTMEASFNMNDTSYTFDVVDDCKAEGTVVLDWVPGYIPPASQIGIVSCSAAVDSMLSVASGASVLRAYDATTAISGGATLVAGTQRKLVLRWSSATRKYQISSIASGVLTNGTEGNFDGAFALGTNLLLHYSNAYPAKYGGLKIFNRKLNDAEIARL